jgi:hypothetical protein
MPSPALAAGGAAARALLHVQPVGFPAGARQWLRDIQFPLVNATFTIDVLPERRINEQLGSCYALCRTCPLAHTDVPLGPRSRRETLAILARSSIMQQAMHDATLYCAKAKRTVTLPRDIEAAGKREMLLRIMMVA